MQPKVSVIMPSLNVRPYIEQCIDSVLGQTLRDIEVICVDAGSDDGTYELLQERAAADPRVKVLHSDVRSYGYQMNMGYDAAQGEYLGIVETDDYADPEMFETLYSIAAADQLDVVKSGYYYYWSKPEERNTPEDIVPAYLEDRIFCPTADISDRVQLAEFFNIKPTIWSAVYRRDFIRENGIRFNETPGASYQDASYNFKVFALAQRVRLIHDCFLHYRQDNEASSINSPGKVYCVCDEYAEMERFLQERPVLKGRLEGVKTFLKYNSYIWNYDRLSESLREEFVVRAAEEFTADMAAGYADRRYFPDGRWDTMLRICEDPMDYHRMRMAKDAGRSYTMESEKGRPLKKLARLAGSGIQCIKDNGLAYTIKLGFSKIGAKVFKK